MPENLGALLLAGGENRRMGRSKAALSFHGQRFLDRIAGELSDFPERLLSLREPAAGMACPGFVPVADEFPGCGPMGGLHAGLRACRSDYLLAVACDMPLFQRGLARYLAAFLCRDYDVFLPVDRQGRVHPLCGIYAKGAAAVLEARLLAGDYRLMAALEALRVKYVPLAHSAYPDEILANINTPAQYDALCRKGRQPPVVAVCGVKNSGKTTFLCHLLPLLREAGLRTAVIKHDGHDFQPDVPGTDSFRLRQAGGDPAAVYSASRFLLTAQRQVSAEALAACMTEADLILLEGGKHADCPKIELVRSQVSRQIASDAGTLLAVCSDVDCGPAGVPRLALDDYAGAAAILLRFLSQSREEGLSPDAR